MFELMHGNSTCRNSTDKILSKIALGSGHILPVLEADETLYDVMQGISHIHPGILPESTAKIHRAQKLFAEYVDADAVVKQLLRPKAFKLTPTSFIHRIYDICKADLQHIVLPEVRNHRFASRLLTKCTHSAHLNTSVMHCRLWISVFSALHLRLLRVV